jgi:hypothetical protein
MFSREGGFLLTQESQARVAPLNAECKASVPLENPFPGGTGAVKDRIANHVLSKKAMPPAGDLHSTLLCHCC